MPSRHRRYQTEYANHFRPLGARRPQTVKGEFSRSYSCGDLRSVDSTPRAGLTSANLGNSLEPQLQRKKIVPYRNNHNIFATDTVKELPDRIWLGPNDGASVASDSITGRKKHTKSHHNGHSKEHPVTRESPLLAAEKKLLSQSSPKKSPPYVSDRINRKSTYSRDFVNYKSQADSRPRKKVSSPKKEARKSLRGAVSPDRLPPAGIRTTTSIGDKRLLQPSDNSDYLRFNAHGNSRVFYSEYASHYKSPTTRRPTKFKYVDGLWIEAPATLNRSTYEEENRLEELGWYKQVLERRNEAYSHASRARGTHFSRENLDRQNLEQALLAADQSPRSVSSVSSTKQRNGKTKEKKTRSAEKSQDKRRLAWSNISDYGDSESAASFADSFSAESDEIGFLERGRSPTPELREVGQTRRHHLDITTNLFNESLLDKSISPSKTRTKSSPVKEKSRKDVTYAHANENGKRRKAKSASPPSSVGEGQEKENGYTRTKEGRGKRTEPPLSASPPSSVGFGSEAGSYVPRHGRDEDVMSEAAMSSRASVASETFDRARKRRDEFWDR